jgi:hypothetical protein
MIGVSQGFSARSKYGLRSLRPTGSSLFVSGFKLSCSPPEAVEMELRTFHLYYSFVIALKSMHLCVEQPLLSVEEQMTKFFGDRMTAWLA